jgi:16S rRNA (adenine1518-N6/adenine1519-N6)-dimethyltransferase
MATPRITVRPKQSLGQNFLIDDNIARNIAKSLKLQNEDIVIEIGPGQGALTRHLVSSPKRLIAVEIDARAVEQLRSTISSKNLEIIHQDFLDVSLISISKKYDTKIRIVGNIPYHLTSPILFKIFDEREAISDITLTMQREVAQRITGSPRTKEYGILSVFSQFYGIPKLLFNVSPNCFYPKPKVTSSVIQLLIRDELPGDVNLKLFHGIVKTVFGKRRKTLRNGLLYMPFEKEVLENIQNSTDPVFIKRPEELSINDFILLTNYIQQLLD